MNKSFKNKKQDLAPTPKNVPPPRTEAEFWKMRAEVSKAAFKSTLQAGAQQLGNLVDVRPWVQQYPWKSSGAAALAGFFVATQVTPAPRGSHREPGQAGQPSPSSGPADSGASSNFAALTTLLISTGTDALKAVLSPWIAQQLQKIFPDSSANASSPDAAVSSEVPNG